MTKRFCDICTVEITVKNETEGGTMVSDRMGAVVLKSSFPAEGELRVEVMTVYRGTHNAGDICKYCILDALLKLDDRAKPA